MKLSVAEFNFLEKLYEKGSLPASKQPKRGENIERLLSAGRITQQTKGRGARILLAANRKQDLEKLLEKSRPNYKNPIKTGSPTLDSTVNRRDSKAGNPKKNQGIYLRSTAPFTIQNQTITLPPKTNLFIISSDLISPTSEQPWQIKADKICFVENYLGTFEKIDYILPTLYQAGYLFIYGYRNLPTSLTKTDNFFKKCIANQILFAPDYDYVGLNDYLNCKAILPHATLYLPSNYDELHKSKGKPLPPKAKIPQALRQCKDPMIKKIYDGVCRTRRYLEQQNLFFNREN